jgi:succinoglycan biosynthesis transport protein ExoP
LEYREITGFIRRRFAPAAVIFIIVLIAAIGFSFLVTPEYEADCMLLVTTGKGIGLLGEIGILKELTTLSKTGTPLDTQIELIRLVPRLEECIGALDLRNYEGEPLEPDDLLEKISVNLYENTDIIRIRAYDRDPEVARSIAQYLAENHLKKETEKDREATLIAYQIFEKKVATIKADLDEVDKELAEFMEREGTIDVQAEARVQVEGLASLEREYYTLRAELAGVRNRSAQLEAQLAGLEPTIIGAVTVEKNPEILDLQRSLNSAEVRLAGLLTRYTEKHPDVIITREQIAGYRERISELAAKIISSEVETPNPVHQQLMREYATTAALGVGLEGQITSVRGVLDDKRASLEGFADKELEYLSLVRRQKVLELIYGEAKARMEQLPVSEEDTGYTPAGRIIKDAQLPEKPVKPNKTANAIAGFIIGLVLAFLAALALEHFDRRLRDPEEITSTFSLKNLGTLGREPSSAELDAAYGGVMAAISLLGKQGRVISFVCFGRPKVGLDALAALATHAASSAPLNFIVLDSRPDVSGELIADAGGGGDLAGSIRDGAIRAAEHPDGYKLVAAGQPYPVELLLGDEFGRFVEALRTDGARAFVYAPVASHPAATALVCAACDGTVLLVEPSRTTVAVLAQAIDEIKEAGGNVAGFVILS